MRVVDPGRHPQRGRGAADGYDEQRPARPQQRQPRRQRDGERGVVAGERPVTRRRALGDGRTRQPGQRPAGPLLVEDHLQHLARPVRQHGAETDQRHPGDLPGGPAATGRPPAERQQQPEHHQPGLGGRRRRRGHRVWSVTDGLRHPSVAAGRPPREHPQRLRTAIPFGRQPCHHPGPRAEQGHGQYGPGLDGGPVRPRGSARSGCPGIPGFPVRVRHGPDGRSQRALSARPESQATTMTMVRVDSSSRPDRRPGRPRPPPHRSPDPPRRRLRRPDVGPPDRPTARPRDRLRDPRTAGRRPRPRTA